MSARDGGPAFPVEAYWNEDGTFRQGIQTGNASGWSAGLTIRDYFAAKVIAGYASTHEPEEAAAEAYRYADAMLKAREAQP